MKDISKHIGYNEAVKSQNAERNGVDNTPPPQQLKNMELVAKKCFEPARKHFGKRIYIGSFFRNPIVNVLGGGSQTSQHCAGLKTLLEEAAIDMDADVYGGLTNKELFEFIRENCEFDQLIWEYGTKEMPAWVHVSYRKGANRKEVLRVYKEGDKTIWENM